MDRKLRPAATHATRLDDIPATAAPSHHYNREG